MRFPTMMTGQKMGLGEFLRSGGLSRLGLAAVFGIALALVASITSPIAGAQGPAVGPEDNGVSFSHSRGYFTEPFTLELDAGGAAILYSIDWGDSWLEGDFAPTAQPYTGPITVDRSMQVRAMVVGSESVSSHSFIDLRSQSVAALSALEQYPAMVLTGDGVGDREADDRTIVEVFWPPDTGRDGVAAPAGVRDRSVGTYRLYFRGEYGEGRLEYDLFPDDATGAQSPGEVDRFNIHGGSQDAIGARFGYLSYYSNPCNQQETKGTFLRDRFGQGLQRDLGGDGLQGQYYAVWHQDDFVGLRNVENIPHEPFNALAHGDDADDYFRQSLRNDELGSTMYSSITSKQAFYDLVDVTNFIDYHLVQWAMGNIDWGPVAAGLSNNNVLIGGQADGPFRYWAFDMHISIPGCNHSYTRGVDGPFVRELFVPESDPDFKMDVADRALLHFGPGGALTSDELLARWDGLRDGIEPAVAAFYSSDSASWSANVADLRSRLAGTSDTLRSWLRSQGFESTVTPVSYSQLGGAIGADAGVSLAGGDEIWYTTDGTDPRAPGGAVAIGAERYEGPVTLPTGTVQMLSRVRSGNNWSAATPVIFQVGDGPGLRVSEATSEFVEITNDGAAAIDLERWRLQGDVRFLFEYGRAPLLVPGESVIIAEDAEGFELRYGFAPAGQFIGKVDGRSGLASLDDDRLRLTDPQLNTVYEVAGPLYVDGVPAGVAAQIVPEAGEIPGLILNEWNAASPDKFLDDGDERLGSIAGNGGDWFETVVIEDQIDVRNWTLVATDIDSRSEVTLTGDPLWNGLPYGTIVTFAESTIVAEDGTIFGTETDASDGWVHIVTDEDNPYVERTRLAVSNDNWQLTVLDSGDEVRWGPVGEGIGALPSGVSGSEVGELEADPSPALDPVVAPYDDGEGSTFGAPNTWTTADGDLRVQRLDPTMRGDVNCDGQVSSGDADLILQFLVGTRVSVTSCPLTDPASQIYLPGADLNSSGSVTLVDALIVAQCTAGLDNGYCG